MMDMTRFAIIVLLLALIGTVVSRIITTNQNYEKEADIHTKLMSYKPDYTPTASDSFIEDIAEPPVIVNQSILDAQEINSEIVGWLTLDGTRVDYPFVQAADNEAYLRHDINMEKSQAGTVFMDYRCEPEVSGFASILYGHSMKNGSMFSDIKQYGDAGFFDANRTGRLYLVGATYEVEIFAHMLVSGSDEVIYNMDYPEDIDKRLFLDYVGQNASRFRDVGTDIADRYLVLSTCAYNFKEARSVIVARLLRVA